MIITPPLVPFLESAPTLIAGAPALLGVPYDGTACFRKGAVHGPHAIREISEGIESYSPFLNRDLAETSFADLGNVNLHADDPEGVARHVHEACGELLKQQAIPVLLGGEHSFTPGAVAAIRNFHPELAVLQLDAHADLRAEWSNTKWSHACAMRRVLDMIPSERVLQCGIRSGTREEFAELRAGNRLLAPHAPDLREALSRLGDAPLYLTLDLDIFDPSQLPGTGTPEPGGIDWAIFQSLFAVIPWQRVVGCDIVELAPALDASDCSTILAAKVVREIILALGNRP
jgi:agmatinase